MRLARLLFAASLLAPASLPAAAFAQAPPSPCAGDFNLVRVSEIMPGMMSKFLAAAAAQQAWYKQAGASDRIEVMRIMTIDQATDQYAFSDTVAITIHVIPPGAKQAARDAAFAAFTRMFKDSSTIKTAYTTCSVTS